MYCTYLAWFYVWFASSFKLRLVWTVTVYSMAIVVWGCAMTSHGWGIVVLNDPWTCTYADSYQTQDNKHYNIDKGCFRDWYIKVMV